MMAVLMAYSMAEQLVDHSAALTAEQLVETKEVQKALMTELPKDL
jgi:VIT1/CCC1 family predicted Fe2+/Mn2+ transporter